MVCGPGGSFALLRLSAFPPTSCPSKPRALSCQPRGFVPAPQRPRLSLRVPAALSCAQSPSSPTGCSEQRPVAGALGSLTPSSTIRYVRNCCLIASYPLMGQLMQELQNKCSKDRCLSSVASGQTGCAS